MFLGVKPRALFLLSSSASEVHLQHVALHNLRSYDRLRSWSAHFWEKEIEVNQWFPLAVPCDLMCLFPPRFSKFMYILYIFIFWYLWILSWLLRLLKLFYRDLLTTSLPDTVDSLYLILAPFGSLWLLYCFVLRQVFASQPRLASNSQSSCFNHPNCWDFRLTTLHYTKVILYWYIFKTADGSATLELHKFSL